jgi:hypothetical protein
VILFAFTFNNLRDFNPHRLLHKINVENDDDDVMGTGFVLSTIMMRRQQNRNSQIPKFVSPAVSFAFLISAHETESIRRRGR